MSPHSTSAIGAVGECLVEAEVEHFVLADHAVQVGVQNRRAALVVVHQRERRRRHRFVDAHRSAKPCDEPRLAGAETADQHDEVAAVARPSATAAARHVGLVGAARARRFTASTPAAAGPAWPRMKSARICASGWPPPLRNTADGWNVGTSTAPLRHG